MRTRAFLAIGAWLVGVIGATGGSLVAVSLIGQSIAGPATQQLTVSAVNRALAAGQDPGGKSPAASPSPDPSPRTRSRPSRRHRRHHGAAPSPSSPPSTGASAGTLLTSAGGSVLAACQAGHAYLISWSPQPGYEADDVLRGPAATARVSFMAGNRGVRMVVSCAGPVPSAAIAPVRDGDRGGWGDDGGSRDS